MKENKLMSTKNVVLMGMFGALAGVLMIFEIPLPFIAPSFYGLDLSEVPILVRICRRICQSGSGLLPDTAGRNPLPFQQGKEGSRTGHGRRYCHDGSGWRCDQCTYHDTVLLQFNAAGDNYPGWRSH